MPGYPYLSVCIYIEIEKLGTQDCLKIILQNIPRMTQEFFDEGNSLSIFTIQYV